MIQEQQAAQWKQQPKEKMFKRPSYVSHSESPTCSPTFSSCAKCRDPAGARSEAGVLHILGSLIRRVQTDGMHFRARFKEVDNLISMPVARSRSTKKNLPICYGADRFYKNTCQTKNFIAFYFEIITNGELSTVCFKF